MNESADESEAAAASQEDAANSLVGAERESTGRKRGRSRSRPSTDEREVVAADATGEAPAGEPSAPGDGESLAEATAEPSDAELEAVAIEAEAEDPEGTLAHDASGGEPAAETENGEAARAWSDLELAQAIEAMLFATSEPLTHGRLAQVLKVTQRKVRVAIERLREEYQASNRAFDVLEIAGGFKLYTRPEHDEIVARLEKVKPPEKLTAAGLETLAIVAYKQPITRAEIDAIRGVQSGAMLKSLTEKKLIRVAGRSPQPGRPIQYGTTKRFLDHFGLASVDDLPRVEDLKAP